MKPTVLLLLLVAFTRPVLTGGGEEPPAAKAAPIPARVAAKSASSNPLWLAAGEALAGGQLDWQQLGPKNREVIEGLLAGPVVDERTFESAFRRQSAVAFTDATTGRVTLYYGPGGTPGGSRFGRSLPGLLESSRCVIQGVVSGVQPGFLDGQAATLVALRTERSATREGGMPAPSELLVVFPFADFVLGNYRFLRDHPRFPSVPAEGARVLLFIDTVALSAEGSLFALASDRVVVAGAQGGSEAALQSALAEVRASTFEKLWREKILAAGYSEDQP